MHTRIRASWRAWPGLLSLLALLLAGSLPAAELADGAVIDSESVVYFTNGRALRVAGLRVEGDWVYLTVSKRAEPEEEPSEIGVLRAQIHHLEEDDAVEKSMAHVPITQRGRMANGARRDGPANVVQAQVKEQPGADVPHVPAAGSAEARMYKPRSSAPEIDPDKAGAGSRFFKPLRNLRVPQRYKEGARKHNELRELQRQLAEEAEARGEEAPCVLPNFKLPAGYEPPPGYTHPCLKSQDDAADSDAEASGPES